MDTCAISAISRTVGRLLAIHALALVKRTNYGIGSDPAAFGGGYAEFEAGGRIEAVGEIRGDPASGAQRDAEKARDLLVLGAAGEEAEDLGLVRGEGCVLAVLGGEELGGPGPVRVEHGQGQGDDGRGAVDDRAGALDLGVQ